MCSKQEKAERKALAAMALAAQDLGLTIRSTQEVETACAAPQQQSSTAPAVQPR